MDNLAGHQRQVRKAGIQASRRRQRRQDDEVAKRADRAQSSVQMGELSAVRQALEGAAVAPGTEATRAVLMDPAKRPPVPREPLPRHLAEAIPIRFDLDPVLFSQNLRCARRGGHCWTIHTTWNVSGGWVKSWQKLRLQMLWWTPFVWGRITALSKPFGGVRGIVSGDIIRRPVARTVAQHLNPEVEKATAPFQFALTTRCGGECVAHAIQP